MFFLRWYLWIAPNVLLLPCLYGLVRRGEYRTFPLFVGYLAAQLALFAVAVTIALVPVGTSSYLLIYRRILIADSGASALLGLGAMYELAQELVANRSSLKSVLQSVLRWTVALLLLAAAACSALLPQSSIERMVRIFAVLDFSSNLVKLGLLTMLALFARMLHVSWRSLPAGIALGFAVSAATEITASPLVSVLGRSYYQGIDLFRMIGTHVCVLLWLVYIFLPNVLPSFTGRGLQKTDLQNWGKELQKMVER